MTTIRLFPWVVASWAFAACAHSTIAGTDIQDTDDNRAILEILQTMQNALHTRDSAALLTVVSPLYFEDMGTIDRSDDYGFEELKTKILPQSLKVAKEIHITFDIHDIVVNGDRAYADVRYESRAHLDLPTGTLWDSHRDFNRIEFQREAGLWRIVAGL